MTCPNDLVCFEAEEIELGLNEANGNDGYQAANHRDADDYLRNDESELGTREVVAYVVSEGGIASCEISADVG